MLKLFNPIQYYPSTIITKMNIPKYFTLLILFDTIHYYSTIFTKLNITKYSTLIKIKLNMIKLL